MSNALHLLSSIKQNNGPINRSLKSNEWKQRSVSFGERPVSRLIEQTCEMSQEMKNSIWYDKDEYHIIQKDVYRILEHTPSNRPDLNNEDQLCQRGLENFQNKAAYRERKRKIRSVRGSVIHIQEWQQMGVRVKGVPNDEVIAIASMIQTERCIYGALKRGITDAHDVAVPQIFEE